MTPVALTLVMMQKQVKRVLDIADSDTEAESFDSVEVVERGGGKVQVVVRIRTIRS